MFKESSTLWALGVAP